MSRRRLPLLVGSAFAAGCLVAGGSVATAAPASAQLCIPIILPCAGPTPVPTPTPTPTPSPTLPGVKLPLPVPSPSVPGVPGVPGEQPGGILPVPSVTPGIPAKKQSVAVSALPKDDSMVFTQPSAQLGVDSLSFTGLKGITLVSVPLADGSRIPVLRLRADSITMDGFALTVRKATGPMLITRADRMQLKGDVTVYLNSVTATDSAGKSLTLGADTPPPKDGITPTLLRVTLGLVGTRADEIIYTNTDQQLKG